VKQLFYFSLFVCLLTVSASVSNAQKSGSSGYRLLQKYNLGGEGGWDYLTVDEKNYRLYISRSTHVMVVDTDTGKAVGDIPDTAGVHGIAVDTADNRGFTSNGRDNSVSVFDLKTLKVLSKIPVGKNPDAIVYDSASERIFTFNGASNDATAIDAKKGAVVGTIALEGRPEFAETRKYSFQCSRSSIWSRALPICAKHHFSPGKSIYSNYKCRSR